MPGVTLISNGCTGWNTSGASSVQSISGDGYVEATVTNIGTHRAFGLVTSDPDHDLSPFQYGIYWTGSTLGVYENTGSGPVEVYAQGLTSIALGDVFRIQRAGTAVTYKKNGATFYTSGASSSGALYVDTAYLSDGSPIADVKLNDNGTPVALTWQNILNVDIIRDDVPVTDILVKTAASGWATAGASSVEMFCGDGYVEHAILNYGESNMLFGLSTSDPDSNYNTTSYGALTGNPAQVEFLENGSTVFSSSPIANGDVIRVERIGSTVYLKKNGTTIYTSSTPATGPLLMDIAIHTQGNALFNPCMVVEGVRTAVTWRNVAGLNVVTTPSHLTLLGAG